MEYMIQYGTNGKDFSDYKEVAGDQRAEDGGPGEAGQDGR